MYQQLEAQQESKERAFQESSPAAYPQLCGSWLGDEWPEDAPDEQFGGRVDLRAGLPGIYAREDWS